MWSLFVAWLTCRLASRLNVPSIVAPVDCGSSLDQELSLTRVSAIAMALHTKIFSEELSSPWHRPEVLSLLAMVLQISVTMS